MPMIYPQTTSWSQGVALTVDEIWQSRGEAVILLATSPDPGQFDGIELLPKMGVRFSAGQVVKYRLSYGTLGQGRAWIAREPDGPQVAGSMVAM